MARVCVCMVSRDARARALSVSSGKFSWEDSDTINAAKPHIEEELRSR